ncbi:MAG: hypothetical protein K9L85_03715 [Candidatus Peribacteraceae bacterium]|nr:hypothetical protein [Candidatus Peribacteraceae bacterium]
MTKIWILAIAILFGAFLFVFGGIDDSPGAQLLGVVIALAGIFFFAKSKKKIG